VTTELQATCHCGAVTIVVPRAPEQVTLCNCSICRRIGGLWCYFPPAEVRVTGATVGYIWGDKDLSINHCATCGCTTHWTPLRADLDRMGINARMMDPAILAAATIKRVDGAAGTWAVIED
jgi:hypothetical protein